MEKIHDESVEELGHNLKLPDWYEPKREAIEQVLSRIIHPDAKQEVEL